MRSPGISRAFLRLADYHRALGDPPLRDLPETWERDIDDVWRVRMGPSVNPVGCAEILYRGSPVGLISPGAGTVMPGVERDLIAALEAAVRREGGTLTEEVRDA